MWVAGHDAVAWGCRGFPLLPPPVARRFEYQGILNDKNWPTSAEKEPRIRGVFHVQGMATMAESKTSLGENGVTNPSARSVARLLNIPLGA
jgi:hypothetical protein